MTGLPLFDHAAAERDRILARLEASADETWQGRALWAIGLTALLAGEAGFIAPDVWIRLDKPAQPKALGAVLMRARKLGLIEPTAEYRPHPERHATMTRVWRQARR